MINQPSLQEIPYFEYKVINELVHAHIKELGSALRAIIIFGTLKTAGGTFDIELLEVVDDWQGEPELAFISSADLPMRGKLTIHFFSAEEFERIFSSDNSVSGKLQVLKARILEGYEIVYEVPAGYARIVLQQARESQKVPAVKTLSNPLKPSTFLKG